MADSCRRYTGGAVTDLLAAACSGARAVRVGAIGTGPNGDLVRAVLAADEIETSRTRG
jgi:sugar/nucleoside kinase (ribokinase family)